MQKEKHEIPVYSLIVTVEWYTVDLIKKFILVHSRVHFWDFKPNLVLILHSAIVQFLDNKIIQWKHTYLNITLYYVIWEIEC